MMNTKRKWAKIELIEEEIQMASKHIKCSLLLFKEKRHIKTTIIYYLLLLRMPQIKKMNNSPC